MTWLVVLVAIALGISLVIMELKRATRARIAWRIAATTAAIVALFFMRFPPNSPGAPMPDDTALLVTEGANPDSVHKYQSNLPVFSDVDDYGYFFNTSHFTRLIIVGSGVPPEDLGHLRASEVTFHPTPSLSGAISVSWNRDAPLGNPVVVRGNYRNALGKPLRLILSSMETVVDSTTVAASRTSPFTLRLQPKAAGHFTARLIAISGEDTLSNDPVPYAISAPARVRLLMLGSSPGFERRFLADWLTRTSYEVVRRDKVSKNKFSSSINNSSHTAIGAITASFASSFDLVLADRTALNELPANETSAILRAVSDGTGLVITTDSLEKQTAKLPVNFRLYTRLEKEEEEAPLLVGDRKIRLPSPHRVFIDPTPESQVLIRNKNERAAAVSGLSGKGKITLVALPDTYPLALSGNWESYSALWSMVLGATSKQRGNPTPWWLSKPFGRLGELQRLFTDRVPSAASPTAMIGSTPIYPEQDPFLASRYSYDYWPSEAGWQAIRIQGEPAYRWYVYEEGDWRAMRNEVQIRQTETFLETYSAEPAASRVKTEAKAVNPAWFLLLFVLSLSFLWIEAKFQ